MNTYFMNTLPNCKYCGKFLNPSSKSVDGRRLYSNLSCDGDEYWHIKCKNSEPEKFSEWLRKVKMILVHLNIIDNYTELSEDDWKYFYVNAFTPVNAIKEDLMEGNIKMPKIKWSELGEILTRQEDNDKISSPKKS